MKLLTTINLGDFNEYKIETEGDNLFECVHQAGGIHSISKCGLCGEKYLSLRAMKTDGDFEYLKVACNKCGATVTFGKTKKDGIMYYRRKDGKLEWEKFESKETAKDKADKTVPPIEESNNDDLPF